jgi:ubiquinone/menaquinone biosynthesis C-methylase UbiE
MKTTGGYEEGYAGSSCLWGVEPGSLVRGLLDHTSVHGREVVDLGAGEGKNAYFLAANGASVAAVELSPVAIANGRRQFGQSSQVRWVQGDVKDFPLEPDSISIAVCYGLFHCLASEAEIVAEIRRIKGATQAGGWNVICAFNARSQDLSAHPGFHPTLLHHDAYLHSYADWELAVATDSDLTETHPHNELTHTHSMTRLLARRPSYA